MHVSKVPRARLNDLAADFEALLSTARAALIKKRIETKARTRE